VARELVTVSGAIGSTLWLWNETEQALQIEASCRMSAEYVAYGNQVARMPEGKNNGPVYMAYRTGVTIEMESPKKHPDIEFFIEEFEDFVCGFLVVLPIGMMHRRFGAIALYYADPTPVTEAKSLRFQLIATQIAGMRIQQELRSQLGAKIQELAGANAFLIEANEEMKHLDRLKGNFMSAVSHELRTPLTSIMGYMELLEDEISGPLTPKQAEFVTHVQDASQTLLGIVDNVLDYVRLEAGSFELTVQDTDMRDVIDRALGSLKPQLEASDLRLEMEMPAEPLVARIDIRRMGQVMLNLLANAIKFTPAGGRLAVRLRQEGTSLRIEVADSGIGIAPEHQVRLFEKFYQVEPGLTRSYGGVGLGLAIVKAFVEAHGGCVGIESALGAGSTFWITMPVGGEEA
jgi:signal transduction histidine kinase